MVSAPNSNPRGAKRPKRPSLPTLREISRRHREGRLPVFIDRSATAVALPDGRGPNCTVRNPNVSLRDLSFEVEVLALARRRGYDTFDPEKHQPLAQHYVLLEQQQYDRIAQVDGPEAAKRRCHQLPSCIVPMLPIWTRNYLAIYGSAKFVRGRFEVFLREVRDQPGKTANHAGVLKRALKEPRSAHIFRKSCLLKGVQLDAFLAWCDGVISGNQDSLNFLTSACGQAIGSLPNSRGRKPPFEIVFHALFLHFLGTSRTYCDQAGEHTDAATRATQDYFGLSSFDPRTAVALLNRFSPSDLILS